MADIFDMLLTRWDHAVKDNAIARAILWEDGTLVS